MELCSYAVSSACWTGCPLLSAALSVSCKPEVYPFVPLSPLTTCRHRSENFRAEQTILSRAKTVLKSFEKMETFRKIQRISAWIVIEFEFQKIWTFSKSFFDMIKQYFCCRFFCAFWYTSLLSI